MLTAVESDQRLTLLLGGLFIDDRAPQAIALMDRSRPPVKASETYPILSGVPKISVADQAPEKRFAATMRRERIELARTAPGAIAAPELFACDPP